MTLACMVVWKVSSEEVIFRMKPENPLNSNNIGMLIIHRKCFSVSCWVLPLTVFPSSRTSEFTHAAPSVFSSSPDLLSIHQHSA